MVHYNVRLVYGYTGEYTGDSTQLVYLRARYYTPQIGRFLTRDTWLGQTSTPMSFNPWVYVLANPVNNSDPTGLTPCQQHGGSRYCILTNGGYLDIKHYNAAQRKAQDLRRDLRGNYGIPGATISLRGSVLTSNVQVPLEYKTYLPAKGLPDDKIDRVALGLYMDFVIRFEFLQGIDPRCYILVLDNLIPHCSHFSNEDMVSDYLGFASYMKNLDFDYVIGVLGGGTANDTPPAGYNPLNYKFTSFALFGLDSCGNFTVVHRQLPSTLLMAEPIEAGEYWHVPKFFGRIDLSLWL
jgi:RHS repeat-associated protein